MYFNCEYYIVGLSIILIIIIHSIKKGETHPILNVYRKTCRYYWLKVAFMYTVLKIVKAHDKKKLLKTGNNITQLEKAQTLSSHNKAIDAVYFNGAGRKGDYLVTGMARRKNELVDGFLYLKVEGSMLGLLETPKLPVTSLYQKETELNTYSAEGITITPIEPMKKWKITYTGLMKEHANRKKVHRVTLCVEWTSDLPYFNFDLDMDSLTMAKSMAKELWSREYFKTLQAIHQTHYEQHGNINGTAIIDGKTYEIDINSLRDHSFGEQREWRSFHRYGLHFLATENGDRFTVGMICMPMAFSCLTMGYVYCSSDDKIYPVTSCDLQLYQHGENGTPPLDYGFTFTTEKKKYVMCVKVIDSPSFYLSKDQESRVVERLCKFKVNGLNGWGAAEWQYRNITGSTV